MYVNNLPFAFIGSGQEWLIVLIIVLVLFGGAKIPQLMRGVGQGVGELQKGIEEGKKTFKKSSEEDTEKAPNS